MKRLKELWVKLRILITPKGIGRVRIGLIQHGTATKRTILIKSFKSNQYLQSIGNDGAVLLLENDFKNTIRRDHLVMGKKIGKFFIITDVYHIDEDKYLSLGDYLRFASEFKSIKEQIEEVSNDNFSHVDVRDLKYYPDVYLDSHSLFEHLKQKETITSIIKKIPELQGDLDDYEKRVIRYYHNKDVQRVDFTRKRSFGKYLIRRYISNGYRSLRLCDTIKHIKACMRGNRFYKHFTIGIYPGESKISFGEYCKDLQDHVNRWEHMGD